MARAGVQARAELKKTVMQLHPLVRVRFGRV